jgi:glycolate oxidase subunit GlcD
VSEPVSEPLPKRLIADLEKVVGAEAVIRDPDRLLVYESDGLTSYRFPPRAVLLPSSTEETAAIFRILAREGLPVVPRGAGTGLSGGALALNGAVVVGTARMNRILSLDPESRIARVQPGVINADLTAAARPHGLYYAPDPSSQSACTLGGNVAENSGGPHCLKYGVTSRYITGLTVVLQDGDVIELGGAGREAPGYDLVGLMVGSEGCLAMVTEIEARVLPLPEAVETLLAIFEEIEDAGRAVTDIIASGMLPAALEIIDKETIRAVEESVFAAGYPRDAGAALVVEFDGTRAGLEREAELAAAACTAAGAREVRRAKDESERAALWKGRKKAFGAMGRIAPDLLVQDATVPRTRLPEVLARISEIGRRYRLTVANVFHAGDGNLHPNILFDRRDADELARVEAASREIMAACVEVGGTITGEHGVGVDKRAYMPLVHSPDELSAMAGVKAVFDPAGLLNPDKVIPEGVLPPRRGLHDRQPNAPGWQ